MQGVAAVTRASAIPLAGCLVRLGVEDELLGARHGFSQPRLAFVLQVMSARWAKQGADGGGGDHGQGTPEGHPQHGTQDGRATGFGADGTQGSQEEQ